MLHSIQVSLYLPQVSTKHPDGVWGAGEEIDILVEFSAPVMFTANSSARLALEVRGTGG